MKILLRLFPAALLIILVAAPACSLRGPEGIRREISRSTGYEYNREFGMTLGRIGLAVARLAMGEDDADKRILRGLTRIQVGVYQVDERPQNPGDLELGRISMASWEPMMSVKEEDEDVLILLKRKRGSVREMLVVVSENDELTIVRMKGKLDQVLEEAAQFGREEAHRQDPQA
jgi:hypothetical protein